MRYWLRWIFPLVFLSCSSSTDIKFDIKKHVLDNKLTVLTLENHTAPIISYHTWFNVGSIYEKTGLTGMAHLFEHMMFKGTKKYGPKQFDRLLTANGGESNAFTTRDYTGYYINIPSDKLELAIDLESDRMQSLSLTDENLKSEREVVKEERRMRYDNSLGGKLYEKLWKESYKVHPYGNPVIGWMDDINRISLPECKEFFRKYYAPNNAIIVVVGDFKTSDLLAKIKNYYNAIPTQEVGFPNRPTEPAQTVYRQSIITESSQNEMIQAAFHIPSIGNRDLYALDVVNNILFKGKSSRLYKKLVLEKELMTSIEGEVEYKKDPGLYVISGDAFPGKKAIDAMAYVFEEFERVSKESVSEDELEKSRNQLESQFVFSLGSNSGLAQMIAVYQIETGDFKNLFKETAHFSRVTKEDVKRVVGLYLKKTNATVVTLKPKTK